MSHPSLITKSTGCEQISASQARKRPWRIARYVAVGTAFLALLAYVGICLWVVFNQRELLYYPQSTRVEAQTTDFSITHDGVVLRGWVIHPDMPHPILYFGGNAERIEDDRGDFTQWFPGHSVYLLAYRGYGASDGKPSEATLFADAVSEFDQIQALHPGQPISVIGRSLGSGVAAYLASQRPVAKLVLVTPFDSMVKVAQSDFPWLPMHWLIKDRYSSASYVANNSQPVLIMRAGNDEVIPAEDTDRLIQAFPRAPNVINVAGRGHNDIHKAPEYGQAVSDFLR
jgi:uncharacterized protein